MAAFDIYALSHQNIRDDTIYTSGQNKIHAKKL